MDVEVSNPLWVESKTVGTIGWDVLPVCSNPSTEQFRIVSTNDNTLESCRVVVRTIDVFFLDIT